MARAQASDILGNLGAPPADEPATQPASKPATDAGSAPATKPVTKAASRKAPAKRAPRPAAPAQQEAPSTGERTPVAGAVLQGVATLEQLRKRRVELRQQLGVRVLPTIADRLRRFCVLADVSQQDIVELALNMFLDAHMGPEDGEEQ